MTYKVRGINAHVYLLFRTVFLFFQRYQSNGPASNVTTTRTPTSLTGVCTVWIDTAERQAALTKRTYWTVVCVYNLIVLFLHACVFRSEHNLFNLMKTFRSKIGHTNTLYKVNMNVRIYDVLCIEYKPKLF